MPKTTKKYYEISAITKVCRLIEKLSTKQSWELADLSRAMNLPKTTVHRMLLTLGDSGYVFQETERGEYSLTYKLFSIGSRVLQHSSFVDVAKPYCRELQEAVDETVNLCVASGTEMLVVHKEVTSQMLRQDSIIGSSFPLFQSASGKIFLAFAQPEEAEKVLHLIREQSQLQDLDRIIKELQVELEEVRRTGRAYDYEEVFKGVRCMAVPLLDFQGRLVATISVSAPTVRLNETTCKSIEQNITRAATRISLRLGASPTSLPFGDAK